MIWNERMRSLRKQSHMTLKEVAVRLGVSEATVQRYESNKIKNIPYETIVKYADTFGCSPSYIMGWDEADQVDESVIASEMQKMDQEEKSSLLAYARFINQNKKPKKKGLSDKIAKKSMKNALKRDPNGPVHVRGVRRNGGLK